MESTFIDTLGVTLDTDMAYDLVLAVSVSATATIRQAKDALRRLNSVLYFSEHRLGSAPILRSSVFPVRHPNGSVELSRADVVDFIIEDQQIPEQRLRDSVKMLDFTLDEVCSLRSLLRWAGLKNRFLSARVLEVTKPLEKIALLSNPQRNIQLRAHSLCRLAITPDTMVRSKS